MGTHMAEPPAYLGVPRWVKMSAIIAVVSILLITMMMLLGIGGPHGPGRHLPSDGLGGHARSEGSRQ
jgi:hypothetical protein